MNGNRIRNLLLALLWVVVRVCPVVASQNTNDVVIAHGAEKKNCSAGVEIAADRVAEVFSKIGFQPDKPGNYYFIVLTDTHIYTPDEFQPESNHDVLSRDTAGSLGRLLDEVGAMSPLPSFAVVTGDLVHDAKVGQFKRFKEIISHLNPAIPVHLCLGNHDSNRGNFQAVFPDRKPYYTFTVGAWRYVVLDSGKDGSLDRQQADWLKTRMGGGEGDPLMVFVHFPLLPYYPKDKEPALCEALVSSFHSSRNERWVFSGHWHSNFLVRVGDNRGAALRQVVTTSSTGCFGYEIPGYRLVCVEGDHVFATIFHRTGETRYRLDPAPRDWPVYIPEKSKNSLLRKAKGV